MNLILDTTSKIYNRSIIKLKYDKHETCALCLEEMYNTSVRIIPCKHVFHNKCFEMQIYNISKTYNNFNCALCRKDFFSSLPYFEKDNFRFQNKLGGGAINDLGYYPISIMFNLFESKKIKLLKSKILKKNGIDLKGKCFFKNENNIKFDLSWGFKSSYENFIKIIGVKGTIKVKFIFSKHINQDGEIEIITQKKEILKIKKANQINLFFEKIFTADKNSFIKNLKNTESILKIMQKLKKK